MQEKSPQEHVFGIGGVRSKKSLASRGADLFYLSAWFGSCGGRVILLDHSTGE